MAAALRREFSRYVCGNPEITFSAGLHPAKPHLPVDRIAANAEHDLEVSKDTPGKDCVTLFGETVSWRELEALRDVSDTLAHWVQEKRLNVGMLHRLNQLIDKAEFEAKTLTEGVIHISDMECVKWRARLAYTVERNAAKSLKGGERTEAVHEIHRLLANWLLTYRGKLRVPLWETLYEMR